MLFKRLNEYVILQKTTKDDSNGGNSMVRDTKKAKRRARIYSFIPTGEYYFHKGLKAYERFDIMKAKKYLQRALELEPLESMIACQLALVYTETGEYVESNQLLSSILNEMDERMTECHYFLANNYAHLGLFSEAYRHARLYLAIDQVGEFAQDAEELLEWIEMGGENSIGELKEQEDLAMRQEEARLLLEEGDLPQAINLLEALVEDHPTFWPAYNNLALAYFYKGETGKAYQVTEQVLAESKGNLHALCNLAVFYYFDQQTEELDQLLTTLEKVRPFILEHRYKLGATFAITKHYKKAYAWLRSLQKTGYIGDASFYYWLAKAAFFIGNDHLADDAWKQLVMIEPEKAQAGSIIDEWTEDRHHFHMNCTITKKFRSECAEERLFGIFLISISDRRHEMMSKVVLQSIDELSLLEKLYLATVFEIEEVNHTALEYLVKKGHATAMILYEQHKTDWVLMSKLLMMWFKVVQEMAEKSERMINPTAFAAATEYLFFRQQSEKKTQQEIATDYNISPVTVRKYMKIIKRYLE